MAKPKLTATMPDGTIATRSTDRDYTHVVAVEVQNAPRHAAAQNLVNVEQAHLDHYQGLLDGTIEPSEAEAQSASRWIDDELVELTPETRWADSADRASRRLAKAVKALAKTPATGTTWEAWSWHGRYDLAAKKVDEIRGAMGRGVYPAIVNVEIVEVGVD